MSVELYDTLSRSIQPLAPSSSDTLRFYCCGPTVYGPAHIGNFRTFLIQDTLRRVLEVDGMAVKHVRNITDLDDKTIRRSLEEGKSLIEFTAHWTEKFHADCEALNMLAPSIEPSAVAHIPQQIALVEKLIEKGNAYATDDGSVYFRVESFEDYGRLSRLKQRELKTQTENSAGEVNDADEYDRESVSDFALWKSRKDGDGDNYWTSPWGEGRPGWHLECSAMSKKFLGNEFDIHGGGIDLIFPHHENEIAQSRCANDTKVFANYWIHNAFITMSNEKMAKSTGNILKIKDFKDNVDGQVLKLALMSAHYKQPLDWNEKLLEDCKNTIDKWYEVYLPPKDKIVLDEDILSPLYDDLNTPGYIAKLHQLYDKAIKGSNEEKLSLIHI